ncbi:MAG: hypothetical protein K2W82_00740 [Candidatus Obscuribacterales bacterium]|nr:hypothetical protein [Candidatus Obscuribacterales bacterium]
MSVIGEKKLKLAYEGSVKRVWQSPQDEANLWFEFSDDYSVFDWGKMPDTIAGKGLALTLIGAFFFEKLGGSGFWQKLSESTALSVFDREWLKKIFATNTFTRLTEQGCGSHFKRLATGSGETLSLAAAAKQGTAFMEVVAALVQHPRPVLLCGQNVFEYPQAEPVLRLVPLEVVFRFGMPKGSSLSSRLAKDPSYAQVLGLKEVPQEGRYFEHPVLEFYTKLEPKDRLLSLQEALLISGLQAKQFETLSELAQLLALALFVLFAEAGIELWDGKFEFVADSQEVLLADSIGPDELRLLYKKCHLSKEMIRQVYRGSTWEESIKTAQELAKKRCSLSWKEICRSELNASPQKFSLEIKQVIDQLYGTIANHLIGQKLFSGCAGLDDFVSTARASGLAEE